MRGGGKARGGKGRGRKNGRLMCEGDGRGEEQGERPAGRRGKRDVRTLANDCSLPSQDLKKHGTSLSKGTCTCSTIHYSYIYMYYHNTCTCTCINVMYIVCTVLVETV